MVYSILQKNYLH